MITGDGAPILADMNLLRIKDLLAIPGTRPVAIIKLIAFGSGLALTYPSPPRPLFSPSGGRTVARARPGASGMRENVGPP